MITRSFANGFEVADYTEELNVVPLAWGTLNSLGLFQEESVEQFTVQFDEVTTDGALVVDKVRGERASAGKDGARKIRSWAIPHFPYDDYISPSDVKGKRAYGSATAEDTLAAARARKIARIAQNHSWTLEYARAKLLTTGDVYAPNGTVAMNFFNEFGVTQTTVDFDLDTSGTVVMGKVEAVIAAMQDASGGTVLTGVIGLCSPEFFTKLITHTDVVDAYKYYSSTQEINRNRAGGANAMHREFTHGGIRFIEMRDSYAGNRLIPANECHFVPAGSDAMVTYFAPANKFDMIGTLGERMYMFEYPSQKGDKYEIESESNFLNALRRPAMIIKGYTG